MSLALARATPAVTTAFGALHREPEDPPSAGDFGYPEGDMLYPVQDWGVKNTFLDISEPLSVSLGGFFKDREVCSCPPRTTHLGGLMTAILEDLSEDEDCCLDEAEDEESEDSGSRLDWHGCESPFPLEGPGDVHQRLSQFLAHTEHQAAGADSFTCASACDPTRAQLPTPAQPMQQMNHGLPCLQPAEVFCVMLVEAPMQQLRHASPHQTLCLSEALPAPAPADFPSAGSAGQHPGQCQPCAITAEGCAAGESCAFSHFCEPSERPAGAFGTMALPSVGSAGHHLGQCQPCAFTAKGCAEGKSCTFCHLCDPSEHKRQKKQKQAIVRAAEWAERVMSTAEQGVNPEKRGRRACRASAVKATVPALEFGRQASRRRARGA